MKEIASAADVYAMNINVTRTQRETYMDSKRGTEWG